MCDDIYESEIDVNGGLKKREEESRVKTVLANIRECEERRQWPRERSILRGDRTLFSSLPHFEEPLTLIQASPDTNVFIFARKMKGCSFLHRVNFKKVDTNILLKILSSNY